MDHIQIYRSPIGDLTLGSDGTSLIGLWINGQKYEKNGLAESYNEQNLPVFALTENWLDLYFNGKVPDFTPPLSPRGTPFQTMVWKILLSIPYGEHITYGKIARRIAEEKRLPHMSAQAVGGAVARNPISIIIPCHRVLGKDGSLTGYAGGIRKKEYLLAWEKTHLPSRTVK